MIRKILLHKWKIVEVTDESECFKWTPAEKPMFSVLKTTKVIRDYLQILEMNLNIFIYWEDLQKIEINIYVSRMAMIANPIMLKLLKNYEFNPKAANELGSIY